MLLHFLVTIVAFVCMEFVAWFTHKFIMHGFLWGLHKDHHSQPRGFFQKNDLFFLVFAIPSWLSIMFGMIYQFYYGVNIGVGIAMYGLLYFLVHDVYIHGRFVKLGHLKIPFLHSVRKAHILHHSNVEKEDGEYFGLISSPLKFILKSDK